MLILKVYVNKEQIDEMGLINTGHIENGEHLYRFRIPENINYLEIYHKRTEPWQVLVEKALSIYNNNKIIKSNSKRSAYDDKVNLTLSPSELSYLIYSIEKTKDNNNSGCKECNRKKFNEKLYDSLKDVLKNWRSTANEKK